MPSILEEKELLKVLFLFHGFANTQVLTLQPSPAGDIAGSVGGQDALGRGQAGQLNVVTQGDVLREFDQSNVVPVVPHTRWREEEGEKVCKTDQDTIA